MASPRPAAFEPAAEAAGDATVAPLPPLPRRARIAPRRYRGLHLFALATAVLAAACALTLAAEQAPVTLKVQTITHRQIDGCLEMTVGKTRLVVVPAWAGRISVLDFGGGNVLWNDPKVDGKVLPLGESWGPWDGNATDITTFLAIEGKSRQWKGLWLHPWKMISVPGLPTFTAEPGTKAGLSATRTYGPAPPAPKWLEPLAIAGEVGPETRLSAKRSYALSADGQSLTYTYTIISHGGEARGWTVCERALVPGGGYALAPVQRGGEMPAGWMPRDKTPADPPELATSVGDFLVLRAGAKKGAGLAARLRAGWLAGIRGGHVLLMTWPIARDGKYPAYKGAHALFWIAEEYLELEPLSPEVVLDEGASAAFTQVWHWLALPPDVNESDPQAVGKWLEQRAEALAKQES